MPEQTSSWSQNAPPADDGRQTVPAFAGASSGGHGAPGVPVQVSFWSQMSPEPGRQTVPALSGASSGGQGAPAIPVQVSFVSHMSPEPIRQTVDGPCTTFGGHG